MGRKQRKENGETSEGLVMASLVDCQAEETKWLWPERIARGSVSLLVGYPDVGKSYVALDIAARVSRGREWPDGAASDGAGNVLLLTAEDHFVRKVQPALELGGADFSRILVPYKVYKRRGTKQSYRPINFKRDMGKLVRALEGQPECKLVIVDPLNAFMGSGAGTRGMDVLRVLRSWYDLAAQFDVAVVLVAHLKSGVGEAIYRTMGETGLTTMARGIWMVAAAPGVRGQPSASSGQGRPEVRGQPSASSGQGRSEVDLRQAQVSEGQNGRDGSGVPSYGTRRWFLPVKNNLAAGVLGMAFSLRQHTSEKVPRVEWESRTVALSADAVLARTKKRQGPAAIQRKEAIVYLRQALAGGRRLVKEVEAEALELHAISRRTLVRARKALRIKAFHLEMEGPYWMELPAKKEIVVENTK